MPRKIFDSVHNMILSDPRVGIKHVFWKLKISCGLKILSYLDKKSAKLSPKCLNADPKRARVEMSLSSLTRIDDDPNFLNLLPWM